MALISSGGFVGGFGTTVAIDFTTEGASDMTAGSRLVVFAGHYGGGTVTVSTTGPGSPGAMTSHVDGSATNEAIFSRASGGGETGLSVTGGGDGSVYVTWAEYDDIDNADPLDSVRTYVASGEGPGTTHSIEFTPTGLPAAGGVVFGLFVPSLSTTFTTLNGSVILQPSAPASYGSAYKASISAGAQSLDVTSSGSVSVSGALAIFNKVSGGSTTTTAWLTA